MPRNYIRKTDKASYSKEKLQDAITSVQNGTMSAYTASKHYDIPRSTIVNRIYERRGVKSSTLGRNTVLSREVEELLVENLHVMEKYGFGLTRKEILEVVGEYININLIDSPFKDGKPGEDWFLGFKKRHGLSVKKPQPVEYARKNACRPDIIYPYFELLEETLNELDLHDKPAQVWNLDETSFSKDPSKSKVVGLKGFTSTRTISSPGKDNTTVLLGCNALGDKTPPLIIYKGKSVWDEWTSPEAYPGTVYAATSNGWMETPIFESFFEKVFLPTVGEKRPILLIYDGHSTHVGLNIIEKARAAGITILKIPPHTSHVLQPLDLAVNKSFKDKWDVALVKWQRQNIGKVLPKKDFSKMIGQTWAAVDPSVCSAGFRKAGIYPFDKNAVPAEKFNKVLLQEWRSGTTMSQRTGEVVEFALSSADSTLHKTRSVGSYDNVKLIIEQRRNEPTITAHEIVHNQPKLLQNLALTCVNTAISSPQTTALQEGSSIRRECKSNEPSTSNEYVNSIVKTIQKGALHQSFDIVSNSVLNKSPTSTEHEYIHSLNISPLNSVPISLTHDVSLKAKTNTLSSSSRTVDSSNGVRNSQIQVLDDRLVKCNVSFEDLLLQSVKCGTSSKAKRRKIATGAELITNDEVYKRCKVMEAEKEEKIKQKEQKIKVKEAKAKEREQKSKEHKQKTRVNKTHKKGKKIRKGKNIKNKAISESSDSNYTIEFDDSSDYNPYDEIDSDDTEQLMRYNETQEENIIKSHESNDFFLINVNKFGYISDDDNEKHDNVEDIHCREEERKMTKIRETQKTEKQILPNNDSTALTKEGEEIWREESDQTTKKRKQKAELIIPEKTDIDVKRKTSTAFQEKTNKNDVKIKDEKTDKVCREWVTEENKKAIIGETLKAEKQILTDNAVTTLPKEEKEIWQEESDEKRTKNIRKNERIMTPKTDIDNTKETRTESQMKKNKKHLKIKQENIDKACKKWVIGETVLTRYYSRGNWKYYIGTITETNTNKGTYKISYLKTKKENQGFRFTKPKREDVDIVPENIIVKTIELLKINENPEFVLMKDSDLFYFK